MTFPIAAVGIFFAIALVYDVRHRIIPNRLTVAMALSGVLYHLLPGPGGHGLFFTVTGALTGGCLLIVPFLLGGMGGGDVKLMAGGGAWLGAEATVHLFAFGAFAGALIALAMMAVRQTAGDWRGVYHDSLSFLLTGKRTVTVSRGQTFPYSIALVAGLVAYAVFGRVF